MRELLTEDNEQVIREALSIPNATVESIMQRIPFFDINDPSTFALWRNFAGKLGRAFTDVIDQTSVAEVNRQGWKIDNTIQKQGFEDEIPKLPPNPNAVDWISNRSLGRAIALSAAEEERIRQILTDLLSGS